MTNDKIKHYLGAEVFNHISRLDESNLVKMKAELLKDINLHKLGAKVLFNRTIELEYINRRLKN
jgi:hypothetical protein